MKYFLLGILLLLMLHSPLVQANTQIDAQPIDRYTLHSSFTIQVNDTNSKELVIPNIHVLEVIVLQFSITADKIIEQLDIDLSLRYSSKYSHEIKDIRGAEDEHYAFAMEFSGYSNVRELEYFNAQDNYDNPALTANRTLTLTFETATALTLTFDYSYTIYHMPYVPDIVNHVSDYYSRFAPTSLDIPIGSTGVGHAMIFLIFPIHFMDYAMNDSTQNDHTFLRFTYSSTLPIDFISFSSTFPIALCGEAEFCIDDVDIGDNYVYPILVEVTSILTQIHLEIDYIAIHIDPYYSPNSVAYVFDRNSFLIILTATLIKLSWGSVVYGGHRKLQNKEGDADSSVMEYESALQGGLKI